MALPTGVRKLPSGRYQWRAEVNAHTRSGTEPTAQAAARARAQAQIELGGQHSTELTAGELIDSWLVGVDHARRTAEVRDHALDQLPDTFKVRPASSVTPPIAAALWRELAAAGVGHSTLVKLRGFLSQAWIHGQEYGYVTGNPHKAARLANRTAASLKPEQVPTSEQVAALVEHLAGSRTPELAVFVTFAASTGARPPGEICALRWDVIDRGNLTARIGASVDRDGSISAGKNRDAGHRTIDISAELLAELEAIEHPSPWVWPQPKRGRATGYNLDQPRRPGSTGADIHDAIEAIGARFRPYDLRHYFASSALAAGVPVPEVAHIMGDNPATVLRVYAHFISNKRGSAVGVVGATLRPETPDNVVELRSAQS